MATIVPLSAAQAAGAVRSGAAPQLSLEALLPPADEAAGVLPPDLAGPAGVDAAQNGGAGAGGTDVEAPRHVGDAILAVVDHLHRDLSHSWQAVKSARVEAPAADFRPGDLLAMQRDLVLFSFQSEVAGKGTSKFIDNINQTVKMS